MLKMRPFDLHTFLVGKLRASTRQCPIFSETKQKSKVNVKTEFMTCPNGEKFARSIVLNNTNEHKQNEIHMTKIYKNVSNRDRVMFNCASCNRLFFDVEYLPVGKEKKIKRKCVIAIDHIDPCIDPEVGFVDWNTYIDRMFNGKLQILCNYPGERDGERSCHYKKTKEETVKACNRRRQCK